MTNDKKTTTLIIIACVIAVAFIAFLLWKSYQVKTSPYREVILSDYPLQKGSKGDSVIALQRQLNIELSKIDLGDGVRPSQLDVDGIFGEKTKKACLLVYGTDVITPAVLEND